MKKQNAVINARIHIKDFFTRLHLVLIIKILERFFLPLFYDVQYFCTYTNHFHFFRDWESEIFIWYSSKKGKIFFEDRAQELNQQQTLRCYLISEISFEVVKKKGIEYVCVSQINVTHIQLQNIALNLFFSKFTKKHVIQQEYCDRNTHP